MTVIAEDDHLTAGAWATCDSNDHTVHFKEPFGGEKCYHIRLISSALFSTHGLIWSELKEIFVFNAQGTQTVKTISEGNNSFKSLGSSTYNEEWKSKVWHEYFEMIIGNPQSSK